MRDELSNSAHPGRNSLSNLAAKQEDEALVQNNMNIYTEYAKRHDATEQPTVKTT